MSKRLNPLRSFFFSASAAVVVTSLRCVSTCRMLLQTLIYFVMKVRAYQRAKSLIDDYYNGGWAHSIRYDAEFRQF